MLNSHSSMYPQVILQMPEECLQTIGVVRYAWIINIFEHVWQCPLGSVSSSVSGAGPSDSLDMQI